MPEANHKTISSSPIGNIIGPAPSNLENFLQVRIITLHEGQNLESSLYCLEKGWTLNFHLGPSLFGREISVFTNHPPSTDVDFKRNKYYILASGCDDSNSNFCGSLPIRLAGSFSYYFTEQTGSSSEVLGSGYFLVNPVLSVGPDDAEIIHLDSVKYQTVLAKSLGQFENWEARLRVSRESGYNLIHFTPVQELGGSNSSYCIKDFLKLNPCFDSDRISPSFDDLHRLIVKLRKEWKVLSICDVVLNHAAKESLWIREHPESTYNMVTSPNLIPAAILDGYLQVFNKEVSNNKHAVRGIPNKIFTEQHLQSIKEYLETQLLPKLKLHEYYTCNVDDLAEKFKKLLQTPVASNNENDVKNLELLQSKFSGRKTATIDYNLAVKIFSKSSYEFEDERRKMESCVDDFKRKLCELNESAETRIREHLTAAVNNCIAGIRYERVQEGGPKKLEVSEENPLVPRYFTGEYSSYEEVEIKVQSMGQFIMASNGWVMNYDSLTNFAESDSNVYLRRELVSWGDTVKLRYGKSIEESPFLWEYMRKYVEMTACIFQGIRLDNCHSTPIHVAEYLLDCAREIRPDLYVVAELFTNSDALDNIFVNRLGITSIIREAMNAWNSHELGRLLYRYGGDPVGSFCLGPVRPLAPKVAHALLFDVTHDNESPIEKKSVIDSLPTAALIGMGCCGTGSTRGFDELIPHHINVVTEKRVYSSWAESPGFVEMDTGIIAAKRAINQLHSLLVHEGFSEIFVDQMNENVVAVTRHNPTSHESVVLVAYTAFSKNMNLNDHVKNLEVEGVCSNVIFEAYMYNSKGKVYPSETHDFSQNSQYINGLENYKVYMKENINVNESEMVTCELQESSKVSVIEFKKFFPGCVIAIKVCPESSSKTKLKFLNDYTKKAVIDKNYEDLVPIVMKLSLDDLNIALYRCSEEDLEEGRGSYNIPGYGPLVYCGLQGFSSVLHDIKYNNDLGHPFCTNLRQGDWILDYISGRLKCEKSTRELGCWFESMFESLRVIPRYLMPKYFESIVSSTTNLLLSRAAFQMSEFVQNGSTFVRALAMGSVQCVGQVKSAKLPPFSPQLCWNEDSQRSLMCAGLPHFATGYVRSWGRDTFIALRGLLLLTGRFEAARRHILGYASCLRHGLIPNLLDGGMNSRFNARDAVWWWLHAIVSYIELAPNGSDILKDPVSRIFPTDDSAPIGPGIVDQPLEMVIQEALTIHFQCLKYRERNAGPSIDSNMSDAGFNNSIGVDLKTGFVYGGNEFNCGTWMDKMGSSSIAGNRGRPSTPRDGSAVELIGLSKAVLRELNKLYEKGVYPWNTVERTTELGEKVQWSFAEWEKRIADNFEKHFWVPLTADAERENYNLINRIGIYKDSVGATHTWQDYQLRCNFLITLALAPEMADPTKAWHAINQAENILLGPLGMKTLDPSDWNYNGDYHNDDNGSDPKTAHGFNYHQGPEWLWPVGFFLRAKLHFAKLKGSDFLRKAIRETRSYLGAHCEELSKSHWKGLPELTNKNGAFCTDGCRVQAWSMACILEVLYDLQLYEAQ